MGELTTSLTIMLTNIVFNFMLWLCHCRYKYRYPIGVVAIPLSAYKAKFKLPGAEKETTMTITTYPLIPAYALTPEKLQGITLEHELLVSTLDNRSPQILYVVHTRVRLLLNLILTEQMTLEYVRKFLPPEDLIAVVIELVKRVTIPSYITAKELKKFNTWRDMQQRYANQALQMHQQKQKAAASLRKRK
jgi:hypothetical protein